MLFLPAVTRGLAATAAGALVFGLNCSAQSQTYQELPGVVVESAGLVPVEAEKVGSSYSVITGRELEQRQIRHAADALREIPGVAVSQSGGAGNQTQVRIRGAEANHAVVRIDGVEVNGVSSGDFDFATLLVSDIDRIEVLRGPQSGVYGSNALAGVINIVTKKGTGPAQVSASAEAGSMNTRGLTANASGGNERAYLSVSAASRETDGFNISRFGSEKDGSEQQTVFARGGVAPTDYFRIDLMARVQRNRTDFDNDSNWDGLPDDTTGDANTREQRMGRISAELDTLEKRWKHKVFADYLKDDLAAVGSYPSLNNGDRRHYGYESSAILDTPAFLHARHTFTILAEHRAESFESSDGGVSHQASRDQDGVAGEYRGEFGGVLFLTGNIRRDWNDAFEDATTYRTSAAYLLKGTNTRLHTSYGSGVTDPTFYEQFGLFDDFVANPSLTPEKSIGWDGGIEQTFLDGVLVVDVTYFHANLSDEIVYQPLECDAQWRCSFTYVNSDGTSERQGVEAKLTLRPSQSWLITGSYTYTDSEDGDGKQQIRRPKHAAALNVNYTFAEGRGQIGAGLVYNGKMMDLYPLPRGVLDDYFLVNVSASYKLDDNITLFGRVNNLFDINYEEIYGYNSAPIAAYGGVKVSFTDERPLEPTK